MSGSNPVIVLGAGVCGLYAGRVLAKAGLPVTVIDKEPFPGGLAAGHERNGNFYELGVHHFHAFDREIFKDIQSILGERLVPVELNALIQYGSGFRRYPLELGDLLRSIPLWRLSSSLIGLSSQQVCNTFAKRHPANAEEALIRLYGRPLYDYFFRDFTRNYWGIPASDLSAAFVSSKMPRLSAVDAFKKVLSRIGFRTTEQAVAGALTKETLWYTGTGAREISISLAGQILKDGGTIFLGSPVTGVETGNGRVRAVLIARNGRMETLPCSHCISTIPVPDLINGLTPRPPAEVIRAVQSLQYRPIAVFGLLVRRPRAFEPLYIYFRRRIFHRVAEPKNSSLEVKPEGHTVLLVEMTCNKGDDRWNGGEQTKRQVLMDLAAEGIARPQDVAEIYPLRASHGYPVFRLGFEPNHEKAMHFLGRFANLRSVGRQGGFCYPSMHSAMRMGADAAREIINSLES